MARRAKKTALRRSVIDQVVDAVTSDELIFGVIDYANRREDYIKQFMYPVLLDELKRIHRGLAPAVSDAGIRRRAERSLIWEGHVSHEVRNFTLLGVRHRPDFEVLVPRTRIALEVKRGKTGQAVRQGLGQSLVYAQEYDFVVYVMIDTSPTKDIRRSLKGEVERRFLDRLWHEHNIRFVVA